MSKIFKFTATIELPDDVDPFDLMEVLDAEIEAHGCEWFVGGQITEKKEGKDDEA